MLTTDLKQADPSAFAEAADVAMAVDPNAVRRRDAVSAGRREAELARRRRRER